MIGGNFPGEQRKPPSTSRLAKNIAGVISILDRPHLGTEWQFFETPNRESFTDMTISMSSPGTALILAQDEEFRSIDAYSTTGKVHYSCTCNNMKKASTDSV